MTDQDVRLSLEPISEEDLLLIGKEKRPEFEALTFNEEWPSRELVEAAPLLYNEIFLGEQGPFGAWIVILNGRIVGDIGLVPSASEKKTLKLGYSIIPSKRRKGFGGAAVKLLLETINLEGWRLIAEVQPENIPSKKILSRNAFEHVSIENNIERWEYRGS